MFSNIVLIAQYLYISLHDYVTQLGATLRYAKMDFNALKTRSMEHLTVARRIVDTTYTIVHEPKLFLSVVNNLYDSFDITINGILEIKGISFDQLTYTEKLKLFNDSFHPEIKTIAFIQELEHTFNEHKNASVEFVRDEKFVMSDNDYNMTALSLESVKKLVADAEYNLNLIYSKL